MTEPGRLPKVRQAVHSEDLVVLDPRPPAEGGPPAAEPLDTEATRSEATMTAKGAKIDGTEEDRNEEFDPTCSLPMARSDSEREQRPHPDPEMINEKSRDSHLASVRSGDAGRIREGNNGETSGSELEALQRLIDAHNTIGFGRGFADDNPPGIVTETEVAIAEGVTQDAKRLYVQSESEGVAKQTPNDDFHNMTEPGRLPKVRQAVHSEDLVLLDPCPPAEGGPPATELMDAEATRSEATMTTEGAKISGTEEDHNEEFDPTCSLPMARSASEREPRPHPDPEMINEKSHGSHLASVRSGDAGRIREGNNGEISGPPAASSPSPRRGADDDTFARSDDASASKSVGEKRERPGSSRGTTDGRGRDREVAVAALAEGIEDGQKIAAVAVERLRELDKSEMALVSARRELYKSRRNYLQTTAVESSMLESQLVRARQDRDTTADRVRHLEPYIRSSNSMVEACQVELRAMRRYARAECESKDDLTNIFGVNIEKLERLSRERVAHADELEREYFGAQRRLETRFGGIEKTIAEMEACSRALRVRLNEHSFSFRKKLAENSSSLANISAKKSALRGFSGVLAKALAVTIAKVDEARAAASEEQALRALVPAGSGRWTKSREKSPWTQLEIMDDGEIVARRQQQVLTASDSRRPSPQSLGPTPSSNTGIIRHATTA